MFKSQEFIRSSLKVVTALAIGLTTLLPSMAQAGDKFILQRSQIDFRTLRFSSIEEFIETGTPDGLLEAVLEDVNESHESALQTLITPVEYNLIPADILLGTAAGEEMLSRVASFFVPISETNAGEEAMRSAILTSIMDDGILTVYEVLQNYPTDARIYIDEASFYSEHFTGLDQLITFFSSSEAVRVSQEYERRWELSERRRTFEPVRRTTSDAPVSNTPVRALW